MAKKSTKSAKSAPASSSGGTSRLMGAVFHGGRMYSAKSKKDQEDFAKLIGEEKGQINRQALARLAQAGAISGFGTKATAAAAKSRALKQGDLATAEDATEETVDPSVEAESSFDDDE